MVKVARQVHKTGVGSYIKDIGNLKYNHNNPVNDKA